MSSNEIETNNVNGSRLAEQRTSSGRCFNRGTLVRKENGLAKVKGSLWRAIY